LLCDGISNREVATRIGITERTVALHVSNTLAKLGAKTRAEAVAIGLSRGLVKARD
jgi:DNA-binding NarL/FixJ family response regulator